MEVVRIKQAIKDGDIDMIKRENVIDDYFYDYVVTAAKNDQYEILLFFMETNVNYIEKAIIQSGRINALRFYLRTKGLQPETWMLTDAIYNGRYRMAKWLVESGLEISIDAIHAGMRNVKLFKYLIERCDVSQIERYDADGIYSETMSRLVSINEVNLIKNVIDRGYTHLRFIVRSAVYYSNIEVAKLVLKLSPSLLSSINLKYNRDIEFVRFILEQRAHYEVLTPNIEIEAACQYWKFDLVELYHRFLLPDKKIRYTVDYCRTVPRLPKHGYWHPAMEQCPDAVREKNQLTDLINELVGDPSAGFIFFSVYSS